MNLALYIAVFLITLGITADNLVLSKMSVNTIPFLKSGRALILQILLFVIQLLVLKYGNWFAVLLSTTEYQDKWIALLVLFSIAIKMVQEFNFKIIRNNKINLELDDFSTIAFATSIYVFVMGFAFRFLGIAETTTYVTVIPCLLLSLSLGWSVKSFSTDKAIRLTKTLAILMVFAGTTIFLINII